MNKLTYKQAGVDIDAGDEVVKRVKNLARSTFTPAVVGGIGGFGGLFSVDWKKFKEPILVSATDGVGTKLKLAFLADKHDTVGIDLVAMSVNDVVVSGAKPLFFLDYIGCNKVEPDLIEEILVGIVEGCREADCALIGGETAELSDLYAKGEYDLAGFCVGVVDRKKIIDGSGIKPGDKLIGLLSGGLHSNGYTLARKALIEVGEIKFNEVIDELKLPLEEEMLKPTKIYVKPILSVLEKVRLIGMAHITGGGIPGNVERILPEGCRAVFDSSAWKVPPIFSLIQKKGGILRPEMFKVFNMGLGMVIVTREKSADKVIKILEKEGEKALVVGEIVEGEKGVEIK